MNMQTAIGRNKASTSDKAYILAFTPNAFISIPQTSHRSSSCSSMFPRFLTPKWGCPFPGLKWVMLTLHLLYLTPCGCVIPFYALTVLDSPCVSVSSISLLCFLWTKELESTSTFPMLGTVSYWQNEWRYVADWWNKWMNNKYSQRHLGQK